MKALSETSAEMTFALVCFWTNVCYAYTRIYLDFLG